MSAPKVFISYNHADSEVADKLKAALEAHHIYVHIDKAVMEAGADIQSFIESSIRETDVTLSLVSNNSLLSAWVAMESINTFYNERLQDGRKFIACYLDDDFFQLDYRLRATRRINAKIDEIEKLMSEYAVERIDSTDLNSQKTRLYAMRNNLGAILDRLRSSLCLDIREARFEESVTKIVKALLPLLPENDPVAAPVPEDEMTEQAEVEFEYYEVSLPDDARLELAWIPGGSFRMGSKANENAQPIHKVTLAPFCIGKYPITQSQWAAIMDTYPSHFQGDDLPVESVTWHEAKVFCGKLSELTGDEYRLPTEAEWEYAAKAGVLGDYCFGNSEGLLDEYAWYEQNAEGTQPVGQKKPNNWGLYDVHGNVNEWCEDIWHDNYSGAPRDGSAWLTDGDDGLRLMRGGAWNWNQTEAGYRQGEKPDAQTWNLGFRVVRVVPATADIAERLEPGAYYRLTTKWLGDGKCLTVVSNDEGQHQLLLGDVDDELPGQYWRITPLDDGCYRLTTMLQSDEKSLDVVNDGKSNDQVRMFDTGLYAGQSWKITALIENCYRLTTLFQGDDKSLAVMVDGVSNDRVMLIETDSYTNQFWEITQVLTTESGWRWCSQCQGLFYAASDHGVCPAGGSHEIGSNDNYSMVFASNTFGFAGWRWCNKCQGMFYAKKEPGICPAGERHDSDGSGEYALPLSTSNALGEEQWRWCNKCQGLYYNHSGDTGGVCPAEGPHDSDGSREYLMLRSQDES